MTAAPTPATALSVVRRYEAAGFRAWPAQTVHYDGTWALRLTPGHPARRLNSVNPLDPSDIGDLSGRIASADARFRDCGRRLTFRMSPLSGPAIAAHLDGLGWERVSDSTVMSMALDDHAVDDAMDQIPLKDVGRFTAAAIAVQGKDEALGPGLSGVVTSIGPEAGLFVLEQDDRPLATAICVHDGDLAGLFEIATVQSERNKGYARRLVMSALKWARLRGARTAWLQVEADNVPATALYASIGFHEIYRYHYRQPPEG